MAKSCIVVILIVAASFANDITISKDSLRVFNDHNFGKPDSLLLKNTSTSSVGLDSARIRFDVFDTTRSFGRYKSSMPLLEMREQHGSQTNGYDFSMTSIAPDEYRLTSITNIVAERKPLTMSPGDSTMLFTLVIGDNLWGNMPVYPAYVKGTLRLYFSNNQIVTINFQSNAPGSTSVRILQKGSGTALRQSSGTVLRQGSANTYCLLNGRLLPGNLAALNQKSVRNAQYKFEIKK
jgi:hypothetical protein